MDRNQAETLRKELDQLLRKQSEVLESRTFGAATDTDILEYEIRQEIIHEMCNQLANSAGQRRGSGSLNPDPLDVPWISQ